MVDKLTAVADSVAETLAGDKIKNKISEIKDKIFTDPILIADIEDLLLNEFGKEPFYNNLTKYFAEHNTIEHLIQMLNGKIDIESKNKFVNDNADKYISKYGCSPNEISNLKKAFSNIFENAYNKKLTLDAHSDTGKLQLDFHRYESQYNSDIEEIKDMIKKALYNQEWHSAQIGNVNVVASDSIEGTSEKVNMFLEKIKDVGKENNPTENDEDAIAKYTKLLAKVSTELRGESQTHIDKVICNINCHLALCYSNLGNTEEALKQFDDIQPQAAQHSKLYHFAKAVIVVNHCIGDIENMYECISKIYEVNRDFESGYNKVFCEIKLMRYSEALTNSLSLFNSLGDNNVKEKTRIIGIISDIYLFMNDNENSFEWAKKAHEITMQHPYDESHQFYMSRAIRTGHIEALSDTFEYKKTHPVVVGAWLKEFKISDDNPVESLTKAIEEMSGESHDEYVKREQEIAKIYRSNIVSNSLLLKHYHQSLSNFFVFASQHKLSISQGNIKQLELEKNLIKDDVFVDALTLIVMNRYDCLGILKNIKNVHICYSTISYLQYFMGSHDAHYVINILKWLEDAKNVVFEIDGYKFDSLSPEFFSDEFLACCNASVIKQMPILTVEPVVKLIQQHNLEIIPKGLVTVSLPGLCYSVLENKPQDLEKTLYNLLSDCKFICFKANTILSIIEKQNYTIDKTALDRFFICDTTCDMISFANVYCGVINRLLKTNVKAANDFTELVLKDSIRIWNRGDYYRHILTINRNDAECLIKSESIWRYLIYLTFSIGKIYADIPNDIAPSYNQIIEIIDHNFSHGYVEKNKSTFDLI